jgi:hypothetical protein
MKRSGGMKPRLEGHGQRALAHRLLEVDEQLVVVEAGVVAGTEIKHGHPLVALGLGLQDGAIELAQDRGGVGGFRPHHAHAHAHAHIEAGVAQAEGRPELGHQPGGELVGVGLEQLLIAAADAGEVHQHGEFIVAVAGQAVAQAQGLAQALGHGHQHLVAGGVAVGVVEAAELVDVHEQHRKRLAGAACPGGLPLDLLQEVAPVGQFGELIDLAEGVGGRLQQVLLALLLQEQQHEDQQQGQGQQLQARGLDPQDGQRGTHRHTQQQQVAVALAGQRAGHRSVVFPPNYWCFGGGNPEPGC